MGVEEGDECEHLGRLSPTPRCFLREVAANETEAAGLRDAVTVKGWQRHAGV